MKIITWNCNKAFRKKFICINTFNADILVIQEAENTSKLASYKHNINFSNHLSVGNENSSLSIFTFNNYKAILHKSYNPNIEYALPVEIIKPNGEKFFLLGIWTKKTTNGSYIVQANRALQYYEGFINEKAIVLGDFNANALWDKKHKVDDFEHHFLYLTKNFSKINFHSVYHYIHNIQYGCEVHPTLFFRKNIESTYHIDYVFMHKNIINNVKDFKIGTDYLKYSDHMPLFFYNLI